MQKVQKKGKQKRQYLKLSCNHWTRTATPITRFEKGINDR